MNAVRVDVTYLVTDLAYIIIGRLATFWAVINEVLIMTET